MRQGFVYARVPHVTLKSIANNAEIDAIWETWQATLEPLRAALNERLGTNEPLEEWQIPREAGDPWPEAARKAHAAVMKARAEGKNPNTPLAKLNKALNRAYALDDVPEAPFDPWTDAGAIDLHGRWWEARIARQREIDASIAEKAEQEYLFDKPFDDKTRVRVAGPFTVESLSPHRVASLDDADGGLDEEALPKSERAADDEANFEQAILDTLKVAGVQQAHKEDRVAFTALERWPGRYIAAKGTYMEGGGEGEKTRAAGVFIGPQFGTVGRPDLVAAAREAREAGFDALVACAFSYDVRASENEKIAGVPVLKAKMNPDLHMADALASRGGGNLFVVFGEPDIDVDEVEDGMVQVTINGVDVFDTKTGEVRSDGPDGIACWFIDTDYNEESFFVRHAYFLGQNDPYKALKTTLKAEIDAKAWASLNSAVSRPFPKPASGRIAIKVINHLGDEVMKVREV